MPETTHPPSLALHFLRDPATGTLRLPRKIEAELKALVEATGETYTPVRTEKDLAPYLWIDLLAYLETGTSPLTQLKTNPE